MGYGVGIPPFGEHGHRYHATDVLPQPAVLADGVHHLAEQFLLGDIVGLFPVAGALDAFPAEPLDLVGGGPAEIVAEFLAGLKLLAVDLHGSRNGVAAAAFVEVAEQF